MLFAAAAVVAACSPMAVQRAGQPPMDFAGPRLEGDRFVSFDGAKLGLNHWAPKDEPWAVIVGVHGMNDYANAFHLAGPWWAGQGVATYAFDQRGFGRSPQRGVWGGELMVEDLRTLVALARAEHPHAIIAVAGESMGGAVAIEAFASNRPPNADRLILLSPAVWGWSHQPLPYKTALWMAARFTAAKVYTPPSWVAGRVKPTDNRQELVAMGRDPLMVWGARSDTLYSLVSLMDRASVNVAKIKAPTIYLYGANDDIIPKEAAIAAAGRLNGEGRSAYYARGYHLLMRDRQGPVVWSDVLAYLRDPDAPLPSGAPPIPLRAREAKPHETETAAVAAPGA